MSGSAWFRRTHRWVSMAFTATVIANFVVRAQGQGEPPAWVTYAPLLPLGLLLLTVNLPDKRFTRPMSPDHRIFATNKVNITRPEQLVVIVLWHKRQYFYRQCINDQLAVDTKLRIKPG